MSALHSGSGDTGEGRLEEDPPLRVAVNRVPLLQRGSLRAPESTRTLEGGPSLETRLR